MPPKERLKKIDNQIHKLCAGPGHNEPTWLPATDKYFYRHHRGRKAGKLLSWCRLCANWYKVQSPGTRGWVPTARVRNFYLECIRRVGVTEAARRTGYVDTHFGRIARGETQFVQKKRLQKVMLELISMRRKGEVLHRDDIRYGALIRGRALKPVTSHKDLNHRQRETDNELRRASTERLKHVV